MRDIGLLLGVGIIAACGGSPGAERPTYSVFDSSGVWLTQVPVPPGFTITEVSADAILGVWLDEDDVPHIRKHRLRR